MTREEVSAGEDGEGDGAEEERNDGKWVGGYGVSVEREGRRIVGMWVGSGGGHDDGSVRWSLYASRRVGTMHVAR